MVPMPGVKCEADIGPALLGEGKHLRHFPDELVRIPLAEFERPEKLKTEAAMRPREDVGALGEAMLQNTPKFVLGRIAGRHDSGHHAWAANGGSEWRSVFQLRKRGEERGVVFAKFDRQTDIGWPQVKLCEQLTSAVDARRHSRIEHNVYTQKTSVRCKASEFRPSEVAANGNGIQRKIHPSLIEAQFDVKWTATPLV